MAGARMGATFARRFKTTTLSAIDDEDLAQALQEFVLEGWAVPDGAGGSTRVRMDPDAAALIVDVCRGEPFLFQLAGEQSWYADSTPTITADQVRRGWQGAATGSDRRTWNGSSNDSPPESASSLQVMSSAACPGAHSYPHRRGDGVLESDRGGAHSPTPGHRARRHRQGQALQLPAPRRRGLPDQRVAEGLSDGQISVEFVQV